MKKNCTLLIALLILCIISAAITLPNDTIVVIEQGLVVIDDQGARRKNVTVSLIRFDCGAVEVEFKNKKTRRKKMTKPLSSNRSERSIPLARGNYEVTLILIKNDCEMSKTRIKLDDLEIKD